jgi:uncharacterized protein YjbI with pentapeptide repeats
MNVELKRSKIEAVLEQFQNKSLNKNQTIEEIEKLSQFSFQEVLNTQVEKLGKRLQEQVSQSFGQVSFSVAGISSSLSLFRDFKSDDTCVIEKNQSAGSHWQHSNIEFYSVLLQNSFSAVQFCEADINRSELTNNVFGFSRLSQFEVDGSGLHDSKIQRSTVSDFTLLDSLVQNVNVLKTSIANLKFRNSKWKNIELKGISIADCEFLDSHLGNIVFQNCSFKDCSFEKIKVVSDKTITVEGIQANGLSLSNIHSLEHFLAALKQQDIPQPKPIENLLTPEPVMPVFSKEPSETKEDSPSQMRRAEHFDSVKTPTLGRNKSVRADSKPKSSKLASKRTSKSEALEISSDIS